MKHERVMPITQVVVCAVGVIVLSQDTGNAKESYSLGQVLEMSAERQRLRANCGPVALARCLCILGQDETLSEVMSRFESKSAKGVLLGELVAISEEYAPESVGCQVAKDALEQLAVPAILFVDEGRHCVVLESVARRHNTVTIWDPTRFEKEELSSDDLKDRWNGETIQFKEKPLCPWMNWATIVLCCGALFLFLASGRSCRREKTVT